MMPSIPDCFSTTIAVLLRLSSVPCQHGITAIGSMYIQHPHDNFRDLVYHVTVPTLTVKCSTSPGPLSCFIFPYQRLIKLSQVCRFSCMRLCVFQSVYMSPQVTSNRKRLENDDIALSFYRTNNRTDQRFLQASNLGNSGM